MNILGIELQIKWIFYMMNSLKSFYMRQRCFNNDANSLVVSFFLLNLTALILLIVGPWYLALPATLIITILLPGLLIYLFFHRKFTVSWFTLVNIIGFGILYTMLTVILFNWVFWYLVNLPPLTLINLSLLFFATNICLLLISRKRWHQIPYEVNTTQKNTLSKKDVILLVLSILTLALAIIGAMQLNNNSVGFFSIISYCLIAFVGLLLVMGIKFNEKISILSLWLLGLSLIASGWLRSAYVAGPDVSLEYQIAEFVKHSQIWDISQFKHAYYSCLSVSILGPVLSIMSKVEVVYVLKIIIPLLYSFIVPIVYLINRSYLNERLSIIATFFFISQPVFAVWWWIPLRQEIAFLFFALAILTVVHKSSVASKKYSMIFLAFLIGMIISHYSTAYLSLAFFTMYMIIRYMVLHRFPDSKYHLKKVPSSFVIIIGIIFVVIWYGKITYGLGYALDFVAKSGSSLIGAFEDESSRESFISQLTSLGKDKSPTTIKEYTEDSYKDAVKRYGQNNFYDIKPSETREVNGLKISESEAINNVRQIVVNLAKFTIVFGVFALLYRSIKEKRTNTSLVLSFTALTLLLATILLPFFAVSYAQTRTFQHLLIVMSGAIVYLVLLFKRRSRKYVMNILGLVVVIYYVLMVNIIPAIGGTTKSPMALSNQGQEYDLYYVHVADEKAATWYVEHVINSLDQHPFLIGDSYARYKMRLFSTARTSESMSSDIMPATITKKSYVWSTYSNSSTSEANTSFKSNLMTYEFPEQFLEENKNMIYSNGPSTFYR